jgi:outer membrane protein TolC
VIGLTIEEALERALANSPEIVVTSFDPAVAKEDVTVAAAQFDPTLFGRVNFDEGDTQPNDVLGGGDTTSRQWESGIRQRFITGAEWSIAYALGRNFDDVTTRIFPDRYEPLLSVQLRQPVLRDAWPDFNLAGVDIAKLNYQIALSTFRQRAEDVSAEVITNYWLLWRAGRDVEIQQWLVEKTQETLDKLDDRKVIDASLVQRKQAEAFLKARQAALFQFEKVAFDVQDVLLRLLSDRQLNLLTEEVIVPASDPDVTVRRIDVKEMLEAALQSNPEVEQSRIGIGIAEINVTVAERGSYGRLDLVASARMSGLDEEMGQAHEDMIDARHVSYSVGAEFEMPLNRNRERTARLRQRELELSKAVATFQTTADRVAVDVKERVRRVETAFREVQVQREAVEAAEIYLQAIEDTEAIRDRLTPEFLLVKLQAQETLARSEREEARAIAEYNGALARLAQAAGTVLDMRYVRRAVPGHEGDP